MLLNKELQLFFIDGIMDNDTALFLYKVNTEEVNCAENASSVRSLERF